MTAHHREVPVRKLRFARLSASVGSISSGCLERAIISEALASITRGKGALERYGKGSRFVDVVLPCGSGVDILYTVDPSLDEIEASMRRLDAPGRGIAPVYAVSQATGLREFTGHLSVLSAPVFWP
ncbi:MAG: XdhC family protein [Parvularculaceae bacterium]